MNEAWAKRVMVISALWSFLGAVSALASPAQHFRLLYSTSLSFEQPLQLFFYRCTWISVLGWGTAYLLAGFMSNARRPVLISGAMGKVAFFFACLVLYTGGTGRPAILFAGSVDLFWAVLFLVILASSPKQAVLNTGR